MNKEEKKLKWWQLSILGTGFIIGTGFFLGSNIAIKAAGPAVLVTFLLAAIGTFIVYDVLSRMTADDPQSGSFSYYSKKAFGNWAGFASGWVYWSSEMLIMGSQLTGISIFTKFWFPEVPIWIFASIYTVLGIIVVLVGVKWFEMLGNLFAIVKLSAIVMFIILAILGLFGILDRSESQTYFPHSLTTFLPTGLKGVWAALLFSFYAFGGIEIMSIYATRLANAKDAPKSGKVMLVLLTTIYLVSIGMSVILVHLSKFTMDDSPFVVALDGFHLAFIPHLFTAILVVAGFSTMSASLYAVTTLLISLSKEGYAPKKLSKKGKLKVPFPALVLTTGGLIVSIVLGLLLPNSVYEYITTAAGLMLLYNWIFILYSGKRLLSLTGFDQIKRLIATVLILLAVTGSLVYHSSRPGFYISIGFLFAIGIVTVIMNRRFKGAKEGEQRTKQKGLFDRLENI